MREHSSAHNRPLMEGPGDSQDRRCDCHFISIGFEAQKDDNDASWSIRKLGRELKFTDSTLDLFPLFSQVPQHKSSPTKKYSSLFLVLIFLTTFNEMVAYLLFFNNGISINSNCKEENLPQTPSS